MTTRLRSSTNISDWNNSTSSLFDVLLSVWRYVIKIEVEKPCLLSNIIYELKVKKKFIDA